MFRCPYFNMMRNSMYYNNNFRNSKKVSPVIKNEQESVSRESKKKKFTTEEALWIASYLNIKFDKFDVEQFRIGLNVELEHGTVNMFTNITNDDPILTGKITLAHLNEFPDYYKRLVKMEKEAEEYWEIED